MKLDPRIAVVVSQSRSRRSSARWAAETASTMVNELMSRTNVDTEVNGML
jgi:hypothetical protein